MSINSAQRQVLNSQKEISSCRAKISNQESTIESLKSALLAAQDRIHDLNDELRKKQQQILEQEKAHQELSERVSEQKSEVRHVVSHLECKISALKKKTDDTGIEANSTFESLRKHLESKERTYSFATKYYQQIPIERRVYQERAQRNTIAVAGCPGFASETTS